MGNSLSNASNKISKDLGSRLQELYTNRLFSDLTISCPGRLYHVHRAIVCAQSRVFLTMMKSGDGTFLEAQENAIDLPEDDPLAVHCMISYFYSLDYQVEQQTESLHFETRPYQPHDESSLPVGHDSAASSDPAQPAVPPGIIECVPHHALLLHAKMYVLGERYEIQGLKDLARSKFESVVSSPWDTAAMFAAAQEVYQETPSSDRELRDVIVEELLRNSGILYDAAQENNLKNQSDLMYDLVVYLAKNDPLAVHCMIRYMYLLDYDVEEQKDGSGFDSDTGCAVHGPAPRASQGAPGAPHHELLLHAKMYVIGDRYQVKGLKELARGKYNTASVDNWNTNAFLAAASEAYEGTPDADRGLRDMVVTALYMHTNVLGDDTLREGLQDNHELLLDLVDLMVHLNRKVKKPQDYGYWPGVIVRGLQTHPETQRKPKGGKIA
ncbi:BTB/POZ fold protein [Niveomyces insectorum RCEF 264]|uniref:BTB/POZ fold protein n=1 Tax=Niveomyces insectorum RCEF 264 TaxID=1081102 RepID=A0A162IG53_9HYPO|nr:BTB/POZ fold protein [Niveomyces insectorum RCEF 264]